MYKRQQLVKSEARTQLAEAKRDVPVFWNQITLATKHALRAASTESDALIGAVGASARLMVREGAVRAEALMREIAGQGPEKTLSRGFAMVRGQGGKTVTGAAQVIDGDEIQIQFHDGKIEAIAEKHL